MTDTRTDQDTHPDGPPPADPHPDSPPDAGAPDRDDRSDIEQAVGARSDAVARGEGGDPVDTFGAKGMPDGPGGTGGIVKNQEHDQQ
jgi:hypothetical protein